MTKQEAAEFLGVNSRNIEHYAKQGRLSVTYTRGTRGQVATYNEDELKQLKYELEEPAYPQRPAIDQSLAKPNARAIAELQPQALGEAIGAGIISQLSSVVRSEIENAQKHPSAGEKLLLTLPEAQALTGLSRATLRAAIDESRLSAQIIGRAWRVKRADLESYVKKL